MKLYLSSYRPESWSHRRRAGGGLGASFNKLSVRLEVNGGVCYGPDQDRNQVETTNETGTRNDDVSG